MRLDAVHMWRTTAALRDEVRGDHLRPRDDAAPAEVTSPEGGRDGVRHPDDVWAAQPDERPLPSAAPPPLGEEAHGRERGAHCRNLRRNPGHIDVLADYGVFLLEQGNINQAAEKFRWILELRPEFAQAMFYLGEICRLEENLDEAMAWYSKAKTTETQLAGPRFRMAQIRLWQNQPEGVAELLRDEIKLACDDEQIMLSIGQMLIRLGEYNDALPCFLRVLDSNSEQGRAYFGISAILMHRRDLEGCLQFLEHAIGVDVRVLSAYLGAALIHTRQNNYQRAFQILHKAKSLLGNSWRLRFWMAKVWMCRLRYAITHRFFPKHPYGDKDM